MERSRSTAGPLTISNPAFSRMKSPIRGSAKAFSDSLSGLETMEFREAVKRLRKRSNRLYEQLKEARFREMVQVKEKQELITQHVSLRKKYHSLCLHFAKLLQFLEREGNEFDELDLLGVLGGHSWGSVWESTRAEYFTSNKSAIEDVFNMRMPDEFVDVEVEFGPGNFGFGLEECRDDPSYSTQVTEVYRLDGDIIGQAERHNQSMGTTRPEKHIKPGMLLVALNGEDLQHRSHSFVRHRLENLAPPLTIRFRDTVYNNLRRGFQALQARCSMAVVQAQTSENALRSQMLANTQAFHQIKLKMEQLAKLLRETKAENVTLRQNLQEVRIQEAELKERNRGLQLALQKIQQAAKAGESVSSAEFLAMNGSGRSHSPVPFAEGSGSERALVERVRVLEKEVRQRGEDYEMLEQSRNELATAAAEAESAADTYKSEAKQLKEKVRMLETILLSKDSEAICPSITEAPVGPAKLQRSATSALLQEEGQPLLLSSSTSVRPTSARLPPSINIVWKSEDLAPHTASWSAAKLRDMYAAGSAMVRVDVMWEYLMKERSLRGLAEETCREALKDRERLKRKLRFARHRLYQAGVDGTMPRGARRASTDDDSDSGLSVGTATTAATEASSVAPSIMTRRPGLAGARPPLESSDSRSSLSPRAGTGSNALSSLTRITSRLHRRRDRRPQEQQRRPLEPTEGLGAAGMEEAKDEEDRPGGLRQSSIMRELSTASMPVRSLQREYSGASIQSMSEIKRAWAQEESLYGKHNAKLSIEKSDLDTTARRVMMEGAKGLACWMNKSSRHPGEVKRTRWRRRWVALGQGHLTYYTSPTAVGAKGDIDLMDLEDVGVEAAEHVNGKKNVLRIVSPEVTLYLEPKAKKEEDRTQVAMQWLTVLVNVLNYVKRRRMMEEDSDEEPPRPPAGAAPSADIARSSSASALGRVQGSDIAGGRGSAEGQQATSNPFAAPERENSAPSQQASAGGGGEGNPFAPSLMAPSVDRELTAAELRAFESKLVPVQEEED